MAGRSALTPGPRGASAAGLSGPAATVCVTPAESPLPAGAFAPAALNYGDVGAIPPAISLAKSVEFMNSGNAPLTVYGVYIAGQNATDFAVSSFAGPTVIAPGASFAVDVTFSPKALGARRAMVCMSCDAANTTALSVRLDGPRVDQLVRSHSDLAPSRGAAFDPSSSNHTFMRPSSLVVPQLLDRASRMARPYPCPEPGDGSDTGFCGCSKPVPPSTTSTLT